MCIFSQPVRWVSGTNIFARELADGRQLLAYEMTVHADQDLAMILPLPVPPGAAEDAIEWVDLSGYPELFTHLADLWMPIPSFGPPGFGPPMSAPLAVVSVGSFEASFVPSIADFGRLDPRFRLPTEIWSRLPAYAQFGFAVFKLRAGERRVHPMAFAFPRKNRSAIFFPTVHIHDGQVRPTARFDHSLFCQWTDRAYRRTSAPDHDWRRADYFTRDKVDASRCRALVHPDAYCFRRILAGELPNQDTYIQA
ncbi:MAG: hypothetical protein U0359_06845 [Byssovorax sp.]